MSNLKADVKGTREAIRDMGVISWYNYGGRLGMWYDYMDGIMTIDEVMKCYVMEEEYEIAEELKVSRKILEDYMHEEGIWEGGLLPEYRAKTFNGEGEE